MPEAERLSEEWKVGWQAKLQGKLKFCGQSFKARALPSDIPARGKGVYLFYYASINFGNVCALLWKRQKKRPVMATAWLPPNNCKLTSELDFTSLWLDRNSKDLNLWCSFRFLLLKRNWVTVNKWVDCYDLITAVRFCITRLLLNEGYKILDSLSQAP